MPNTTGGATEGKAMMNSNWLVVQAIADRKALTGFGFSKGAIEAMSHQEVCKELKRLGYSWKKQSKRNGHGCA
jgi:hypothetical protein